jgi:hypothetical protein
LIEARGCELVYLPSYSPDLNPIEEALSKIKHILRKIAARTKEALIEAMGRALAAVSVQDVKGSSLTVATALRRSNYERRCEMVKRPQSKRGFILFRCLLGARLCAGDAASGTE